MKNQEFVFLDAVKKRLKKRKDHELFYQQLGVARKLGLHDEFVESVYNYLDMGKDIGLAIDSAMQDWDL